MVIVSLIKMHELLTTTAAAAQHDYYSCFLVSGPSHYLQETSQLLRTYDFIQCAI